MFSDKFRKGGDLSSSSGSPAGKPGNSGVAAALDTLERAATSPRQHSAIKTLRDEFNVGSDTSGHKAGPATPGQKAAHGAAGDIFAGNAGKSAAARFGR